MYSIGPRLKGIFERQRAERADRPPGPAERPVTTVKGTALFDLQFRGEVEGHSFISDERESSGGHDAGPAPMRYFVASVMFCHKVWTVKTAALMDLQLDRLDGEISWYNDVPTPRIVYKLFIDSGHGRLQIRRHDRLLSDPGALDRLQSKGSAQDHSGQTHAADGCRVGDTE